MVPNSTRLFYFISAEEWRSIATSVSRKKCSLRLERSPRHVPALVRVRDLPVIPAPGVGGSCTTQQRKRRASFMFIYSFKRRSPSSLTHCSPQNHVCAQ